LIVLVLVLVLVLASECRLVREKRETMAWRECEYMPRIGFGFGFRRNSILLIVNRTNTIQYNTMQYDTIRHETGLEVETALFVSLLFLRTRFRLYLIRFVPVRQKFVSYRVVSFSYRVVSFSYIASHRIASRHKSTMYRAVASLV